ncbi:MAG TPA: glycoside hydrolase family 3 C-terminal domain-containing protein [Streptosporangiaceae bacterium]|nr:glycoside hydrolase family 3 C-terminal domain-containing protein [Streptosporangiaceae bacterium]
MTGQLTNSESAAERDLVAMLTTAQKIRLLTGEDAWSSRADPVIGLRSVVLSDGPAGVRGVRLDASDPSSSLPCPVALGATWDEDLVREVAGALGREARGKGVGILLAPTINIVRTPLAGRGFECFSEDPVLTARMAVGYVRGLQHAGVGATAKHYVGNDSETGRRTYDARIPEHVLRELYLVPFEACVTEADVAMVMAAYNSVNGATMTANAPLLRGVLKGEWGFTGVVVSDWRAARTTAASALAGLDLVMPGPGGPWGDRLVAAVEAGEVPEAEIDDKLTRLLRIARRVGALEAPPGDGQPAGGGAAQDQGNGQAPERLPQETASGSAARPGSPGPAAGGAVPGAASPVDPALLRRAAARSFVLLRNERGVLPLDSGALRSVAVIGPNATHPQTQGGGSVRVLAFDGRTPADALRAALDGSAPPGTARDAAGAGGTARVHVHEGCRTWATVPVPGAGTLRDPVSGASGLRFEARAADGRMIYDERHPGSVVTWWDGLPREVYKSGATMIMRAIYRAASSGRHVIGAAGVGAMRVDVGGVRAAEASSLQPAEFVEVFSRPPEIRLPVELRAGQEVEVRLEHEPDRRGGAVFVTMRLGIAPEPDEEDLLAEAAEAARTADVAVVVVGSADATESEGYDRETLALPGRQDELVSRIAAVNPDTVVVVNSGMPVRMPWIEQVAAVVCIWLPGQAGGDALADVLLGRSEPGGRLPVTLPRREADAPVLHAFPKGSELPYSEGLLVGYRGYDRAGNEPLFCFGHGLGYTEWEYESVHAAAGHLAAGQDLELTARVRNGGGRTGREIVQVYLEDHGDDPNRPLRALAAFAPVDAEPGGSAEVRLKVPARAFARYGEAAGQWVWPPGDYTLHVGRSSRDLRLHVPVTVK